MVGLVASSLLKMDPLFIDLCTAWGMVPWHHLLQKYRRTTSRHLMAVWWIRHGFFLLNELVQIKSSPNEYEWIRSAYAACQAPGCSVCDWEHVYAFVSCMIPVMLVWIWQLSVFNLYAYFLLKFLCRLLVAMHCCALTWIWWWHLLPRNWILCTLAWIWALWCTSCLL